MLDESQVEELFRRLHAAAPEGPRRPHVKEDADPFRALVACLLSAQSRDENTARAKFALFTLADTPEGILDLDDQIVADAIRPAGLYNMKTARLKELCRTLIGNWDGEVPRSRERLMALPGIGRKCADIMLRFSFGRATIAVDTHIHRLCSRTGLARGRSEAQTAAALDALAPEWAKADGHLLLLDFAKAVCRARAPKCPTCLLSDLCEAFKGAAR